MGGDTSIDYTNPDVTASGTLAGSGSVNVATTKRAKLIVVETNAKSNTDHQGRNLLIFEVDKGGVRIYVNSSGTRSDTPIDSSGTVSTGGGFTVTDNQVTFTNVNSIQMYYTMAIYY